MIVSYLKGSFWEDLFLPPEQKGEKAEVTEIPHSYLILLGTALNRSVFCASDYLMEIYFYSLSYYRIIQCGTEGEACLPSPLPMTALLFMHANCKGANEIWNYNHEEKKNSHCVLVDSKNIPLLLLLFLVPLP